MSHLVPNVDLRSLQPAHRHVLREDRLPSSHSSGHDGCASPSWGCAQPGEEPGHESEKAPPYMLNSPSTAAVSRLRLPPYMRDNTSSDPDASSLPSSPANIDQRQRQIERGQMERGRLSSEIQRPQESEGWDLAKNVRAGGREGPGAEETWQCLVCTLVNEQRGNRRCRACKHPRGAHSVDVRLTASTQACFATRVLLRAQRCFSIPFSLHFVA